MMEHIARLMLTRARANGKTSPRADPKVYALIATSPTIDIKLRARTLQAALKRLGCARRDHHRRGRARHQRARA